MEEDSKKVQLTSMFLMQCWNPESEVGGIVSQHGPWDP